MMSRKPGVRVPDGHSVVSQFEFCCGRVLQDRTYGADDGLDKPKPSTMYPHPLDSTHQLPTNSRMSCHHLVSQGVPMEAKIIPHRAAASKVRTPPADRLGFPVHGAFLFR